MGCLWILKKKEEEGKVKEEGRRKNLAPFLDPVGKEECSVV